MSALSATRRCLLCLLLCASWAFDFSKQVQIRSFDGLRGVGAVEKISRGQVVLTVPRTECTSARSEPGLSSREALAFKAQGERIDELPVHWSDAELEALCDEDVMRRAQKRRARRRELPDSIDVVSTRAFEIDVDRPRKILAATMAIPLAFVALPEEAKIPVLAISNFAVFVWLLVPPPSTVALVPGACLFNHGTPANAKIRYDVLKDSVLVTASDDVEEGEQLFFDYRASTLANYLLDFGFVDGNLPRDMTIHQATLKLQAIENYQEKNPRPADEESATGERRRLLAAAYRQRHEHLLRQFLSRQ